MAEWKLKRSLLGGTRIVGVFEPMEREVIGDLASAVASSLIRRCQSAPKDPLAELTGMPSGHKEAPEEPGLARLLPDFERENDQEFDGDQQLLRSLHEVDICKAKLEALQIITEALGPNGGVRVIVEPDEIGSWLQGLNDIRLWLAATEVTHIDGVALDRDAIVTWIGAIQEHLLELIDCGPCETTE